MAPISGGSPKSSSMIIGLWERVLFHVGKPNSVGTIETNNDIFSLTLITTNGSGIKT